MHRQTGSTLVMALIVMAMIAGMVVALTTSTNIDLTMGRNVRLMKQAFLWSDSGLDVTEELIGYSEYTRGLDANASFPKSGSLSINGTSFRIVNTGDAIYNNNSTSIVNLSVDGAIGAVISVDYLGSVSSDGTSIVFASGYMGIGKGLAAGGAMARIYSLRSIGYSDNSKSRKRSAEIYRSLSSGK